MRINSAATSSALIAALGFPVKNGSINTVRLLLSISRAACPSHLTRVDLVVPRLHQPLRIPISLTRIIQHPRMLDNPSATGNQWQEVGLIDVYEDHRKDDSIGP